LLLASGRIKSISEALHIGSQLIDCENASFEFGFGNIMAKRFGVEYGKSFLLLAL
jgi:hypothetical protein